MEDIIENSRKFLLHNPEYNQVVIDWINFGNRANYHKISKSNLTKFTIKYDNLLTMIEKLLVNANIKTTSEIILNRETSFPISDIPLLTATTSREEPPGCFGDIFYSVIIPKDTPIFFINALDLNKGLPLIETEEEFLIGPVKTKLINNKIYIY